MRGSILALCALALAGAPAAAQTPNTNVRAYLEHGMGAHAAAGYARERTVPDLEATLELDRPYLWSIYLLEDETYRIYAACDDACSDIDMEIYGADGRFIERDAAPDDTPFVQVTPDRAGRYYVRVWLYACDAAACDVAARVMSGGAPVARGEGRQ